MHPKKPLLPRNLLAIGIWFLTTLASLAQPVRLTRNINVLPTGDSSDPGMFAELNGSILFSAADGANGTELWVTDGSELGTALVRDIYPGVGNSFPNGLTTVGGIVIFAAEDDSRGTELWRSDGTQLGTQLVKDISPGFASGMVQGRGGIEIVDIQILNGVGYFGASEPDTGKELWRSDGTEAGTTRVKDICLGPCDGFVQFVSAPGVIHNGVLFFIAFDPDSGRELWKTDGTPAGTMRVKDICAGTCIGLTSLERGVDYGGGLMFVANEGTLGNELWETDGTADGTHMVRDIYSGMASSNPTFLGVFGNEVFFSASSPDGNELWKSDGTEAGTLQVSDICPGSCGAHPEEFQVLGDGFLFKANDAVYGRELWKSDGTPSGTTLLLDVDPGPASSNPTGLSDLNGEVLFSVRSSSRAELWKSDGTASGTGLVKAICGGSCLVTKSVRNRLPEFITLSATRRLFSANDGLHGIELWVTDGTSEGTQLVKDISGAEGSSFPRDLAGQASGQLLFRADDGAIGFELWSSDGTESGTALVKDINPGSGSSTGHLTQKGSIQVRGLTAFGNGFFFGADDGIHGLELWKTDGTASGTQLVKDLRLGVNGSFPTELTNIAGTLFLVADQKLWVSDGSSAGTSIVTTDVSQPGSLIGIGGSLFFVGFDSTHGFELWRSDGTSAGTTMVKDILPGAGSALASPTKSSPNEGELAELNGALLFGARDQDHGKELWRSDGTSAGTVLLKDINPGGLDSGPVDFAQLNGIALFRAGNMSEGTELWMTDGTSGGTSMLKDICPGACSGFPEDLTAAGGRIFFSANDGVTGWELWQSDGTPDGTFSMDLYPGPLGSVPMELTAIGDKLVFAASNGLLGSEVWVSDGTAAGTFPLQDLRLGPGSSSPGAFTLAGDRLFFSADDGESCVELWSTPLEALSRPLSDVDGDMVPDIDDPCPADPTDQCDPNGSSAEQIDSTSGGQVATPDGNLSLDIPAGSLDGDTTVSVTATETQPNDPAADLKLSSSPESVGLGQIIAEYDFQPDGITFDPPARLTIKADVTDQSSRTKDGCREITDPLYDPSAPCKLTVYTLNEENSSFEPDPSAQCVVRRMDTLDEATCTVYISHFSVYAVIAPADSDRDGVPDLFPPERDYCAASPQTDSHLDFIGDLVVATGDTGLATVTFGARLTDSFDQPIPGASLVFSGTDAAGSNPSECLATTDGDGIAQCSVEQVSPDLYTVTSWFDGVSGCFVGSADTVFVAVFDPDQPRATGGGFFYPDADSTLPAQTDDDRARFGFVVEVDRNDEAAGNLEFQYQAAGINLKSQRMDWYTISNNKAIFQGVATINGTGAFTFRVQATDGDQTGHPDHFDIVIWAGTNTESAPYHRAKNELAGGNIVVHKR